MSSAKYAPAEIEPKWQKYWAEHKTFKMPNPGEPGFDASKPKYYVLDMFPYPSGAGLHVGHPEGYTATDILARYKRAGGFNVLHPMGWDAFGLPAEQYAVQTGTHPATTTAKNINSFRATLQRLGFSYDWEREVDTTDPNYYKWTQWIFLKLFNSIFDTQRGVARPVSEIVAELDANLIGVKHEQTLLFGITGEKAQEAGLGRQWGEMNPQERWRLLANHRLAYVSEAPVWWCEALGTVLANEEVIEGRSERGDHPCVKKPLRQWMLRITAYAERLMNDLDLLDWPESIKLSQRNWIGRSEGAEVDFEVVNNIAQNVDVYINDPGCLWEKRNTWLSQYTDSTVELAFDGEGESTIWGQFDAPTAGHGIKPLSGLETWARLSADASNAKFRIKKARVIRARKSIRVFTTRPDTLYGATYMVLAPEHPLVKEITAPEQRAAVEQYVLEASRKSDLARTDLAKEKSGVFSGAYAFNPVYDREDPRAKIPIWIADYVLMGYGTGAIMAVPAHDERDAEFALKFRLPIVSVVMPPDDWFLKNSERALPTLEVGLPGLSAAPDSQKLQSLRNAFCTSPTNWEKFFVDDGIAFNSPVIDGLHTPDAKKKIIAWLEERKLGTKKITYRLRDWLFSRQRYWGEPFPIVWDEHNQPRALSEDSLPLTLPEMSDFKPSGSPEGPLSKAKEWVNCQAEILADGSARVVKEAGGTPAVRVRRETNTMPQWAGSCWYFLRYLDPKNANAPFAKEIEKYWMNVDLYVGGAEHAVLHLLYSRFWYKVLFDLGLVKDSEPFQKLFNQGLITAFSYLDSTGRKIPTDEVEEKTEGVFVLKSTGEPVKQIVAKMSKTLKNVVDPMDTINEFGGDTLRLYEMFMGPLEGSKPWNPRDVPGMYRFLRDCWKMIVEDDEREATAGNLHMNLLPSASELIGAVAGISELERLLHKTIKGVTQDLDRMAFNTAISKLMVFKNAALKDVTALSRSQAERFVVMLSVFAPHIAEELWSRLRHPHSVALQAWPKFDESLTQDALKELAIQVNGKIKARITVAADAPEEQVRELAQKAVAAELAGKTIVNLKVVPGRLVNIAVK